MRPDNGWKAETYKKNNNNSIIQHNVMLWYNIPNNNFSIFNKTFFLILKHLAVPDMANFASLHIFVYQL
jgi:hypothetical protein